MSVFNKRGSFKPFDYPEVEKFKNSIQNSYWVVSEFNFQSSIKDFYQLDDGQKSIIKNALLAISQIEVSVKRFWVNLGLKLQKEEFDQVGIVFGESEVRHADAYSKLLDILDLNHDFSVLLQNPVIQGRVDYLQKYLKNASDNSNESFVLSLTLFSIFIENVSLFSQFLIIQSFFKHKNILKDIDNVVQATRKEETLHALFGIYIIKLVKQENPDWFTEEFYKKIKRACVKAYEAECKIIDWIFEKGELEFLTKEEVKNYISDRLNDSLKQIDYPFEKVFEVDETLLEKVKWFKEEEYAVTFFDFFNKRPVTYSKSETSITEEDLF